MEVNDPLPKVSPGSVGKVSTKNISNRTIKESRLGMSIMTIHNYNYARDFRISEIRVWGAVGGAGWGGVVASWQRNRFDRNAPLVEPHSRTDPALQLSLLAEILCT